MKTTATLILLAWLALTPAAFAMKVGSYNIRYDTPGDLKQRNSWPQRAPVIASLIRFHDFDVLGTQETLPNQMQDLQRLLPEFACVSHGRDDGKLAGEHIAIFYKKDSFQVIKSGCFWLSETPDLPGKGWDADLPRICTWAKMSRQGEDKPFLFLSVHFDHRGKLARHESALLILRKIAELAGNDPVFLVGDFNSDQDSEPYQVITRSGSLVDAAYSAEVRYLLNGTANRFDPNGHTPSRIDHVFASPGVRLRRFGVLTDSYRIPKEIPDPDAEPSRNFPAEVKFSDFEARLPSDHFPILAETAGP